MMKKLIIRYKNIIWFVLLLFFQILILFSYENKKSGYHIDEMYSFEGAHLIFDWNYNYWVEDYEEVWKNQWLSGEDIRNYFSVKEESRQIVNIAPSKIVHLFINNKPYYVLLNLTMSLGNQTMSKWYGFILNIVLWTITQIVLYKIGVELLGNNKGIRVPLLYGISAGAISMVMYIRMYMLWNLLIVLALFFHLKLYKAKKWYVFLGYVFGSAIVALLAIRTQEYTAIFAICLVISFEIACFIHKKIAKGCAYLGLGTLGLILYVIVINPKFIQKMLNNPYVNLSKELLENRNYHDYVHNLKSYAFLIMSHTVGGVKGILLGLILLGVTVAILWLKTRKQQNIKLMPVYSDENDTRQDFIECDIASWIIIIVPGIVYYFVYCFIAFYDDHWRYISCIYPSVVLLIVGVGNSLLHKIQIVHKQNLLFLLIVLGCFIGTVTGDRVDELYREGQEITEAIAPYKQANQLMVTYHYAHKSQMQIYRDTYFMDDDQDIFMTDHISVQAHVLRDRKDEFKNGTLLWLSKYFENNPTRMDMIYAISEELGYENIVKITDSFESEILYLY